MQGITDCTGKAINIGDFVKTPTGKVVQVEGGIVMAATLYNAAGCTVVPKPHDHKPTPKEPGHMSDSQHQTMLANDSDCVIWGS